MMDDGEVITACYYLLKIIGSVHIEGGAIVREHLGSVSALWFFYGLRICLHISPRIPTASFILDAISIDGKKTQMH